MIGIAVGGTLCLVLAIVVVLGLTNVIYLVRTLALELAVGRVLVGFEL